jgi:hypothetical protein
MFSTINIKGKWISQKIYNVNFNIEQRENTRKADET